MKFKNEEERIQHPLASLIPRVVWKDYFDKDGISEKVLRLMEAKESDLDALLESVRNRASRREAWFAIAYSHPDLSNEKLFALLEKLQIPEEESFMLAGIFGQLDFFEYVHQDGYFKCTLSMI